jgi:hypothetical protein
VAAAGLVILVACAAPQAQQSVDAAAGLRGGADDASSRIDATTAANTDADAADMDAGPQPRKKTTKPKPGDAKSSDPRLPPLKPYKGAQRLDTRGGPVSAALPTPPPRRRVPVEENPYDPLGAKIGDLKLTPYVEEDVGFASNPSQTAGAVKASGFETTEVGLGLQSDWNRGDLHGNLTAGYKDYFATPLSSGPYGSGTVDDRLDVSRDLSLDAEARYNVQTESLSTLGLATSSGGAASSEAMVSTFGGSVGASQKFGDLTLALHGSLDRTTYQQSDAGGANALGSDDYDDIGLHARASYRLSAAISPFFDLAIDTRRYDTLTDASGYERDSNGGAAKAGLTVAYSQKLTGEISVGYGARDYQDPRLPSVRAPLFDASLIWSVTPLTTVTGRMQSLLQDSVLAGASSDINRSYTIDISHTLTRQIKLGLTGAYSTDDYVGVGLHDSSLTIGASAEYHLSREVVLKANATRQQFTSSAANSNYVANVFMFGVRLQR